LEAAERGVNLGLQDKEFRWTTENFGLHDGRNVYCWGEFFFFVTLVYLQSVQVHLANAVIKRLVEECPAAHLHYR
jgi:hypothetical protein